MPKNLTAVYALIATACASWQTQQREPAAGAVEQAGAEGEHSVRVELKSGTRYEIYGARVVGDSIIGRATPSAKPESERIAVATSDVKSVSRHKLSTPRTVLTVVAIMLGVSLLFGG